ncbi:hypothetical protein [Streptomyces collinus]|uniref:hypothetical protein n=1 Tax=Streptomyces collinus TaxID=42684 RepID=UPI002941D269|nr:hypothetical protein [Streptomyces collinus]
MHRPDHTQPDHTQPGGTRPGGTRPDRTRPDRTRPGGTRPDRTRPERDGPLLTQRARPGVPAGVGAAVLAAPAGTAWPVAVSMGCGAAATIG